MFFNLLLRISDLVCYIRPTSFYAGICEFHCTCYQGETTVYFFGGGVLGWSDNCQEFKRKIPSWQQLIRTFQSWSVLTSQGLEITYKEGIANMIKSLLVNIILQVSRAPQFMAICVIGYLKCGITDFPECNTPL